MQAYNRVASLPAIKVSYAFDRCSIVLVLVSVVIVFMV